MTLATCTWQVTSRNSLILGLNVPSHSKAHQQRSLGTSAQQAEGQGTSEKEVRPYFSQLACLEDD